MMPMTSPGWVREPVRTSVRERVETAGGRTFRLAFSGKKLEELTELTDGDERLVSEDDAMFRRWAAEVAAGAFEDDEEDPA